jgi:hypothetical protein
MKYFIIAVTIGGLVGFWAFGEWEYLFLKELPPPAETSGGLVTSSGEERG